MIFQVPEHEHPDWKAIDHKNYHLVRPLLSDVTFNILFARMVLDKKVSGFIYVDDLDKPNVCFIQHPYGMLLLAGGGDADFKHALKNFVLKYDSSRTLWLQSYPDTWWKILPELMEHRSTELVRVNFKFNEKKYLALPSLKVPERFKIVETNHNLFQKINGTVVPKYFWNTANDFVEIGKGFTIMDGGVIISSSFSAFVIDDCLELGIETYENYRGKGFAEIVSRPLIDHCLENNMEPVWSCRKDNIGSLRLAEKLGFEVSLELPYYELRK